MGKLILSLLFLILSMTVSYSSEVILITNGTVTGTNGQQIKIISNYFEKENYKTEIKITNQNCALAKLLWDSSKEKTLMLISGGIDGLTDKDNSVCYMKPEKEQLFFWLHTSPYFFCSAGNKTWNDFVSSNTTHTVIIHPENRSAKLFEEISKKYQNNIRTIKVNASSATLTMVKANEVDFVFRSGIFDLEVFKDKCLWSSFSSHGLKQMKDFLPEINMEKLFVANGYIIAKNFNSNELEKILNIMKLAADSNDMMKINQRRNYDPKLVNFNSKFEYNSKINELYELLSD